MKAIRTILLVGLASGLALAADSRVLAAEAAPALAPAQPAASALTGKVVAVDKAKKSITVDINGRMFVFKLSPQLAVRLNSKDVPATSLAPGQTISLTARRNTSGSFEIVALDIQPNDDAVVAAGGPRGPVKGASKKSDPHAPPHSFNMPAPFRTEPNPANVVGNVHSPH
jgi:hypothetical protein